ncbi:5'-adenylylsulfate reductase-like 4 [Senna tora]|uniref:5'-adenylylsulfate reductase-like 4 n=1 Tax=Senna tora TaxID=362788 RepID=A0A834TYZ0_9FABA|nr:5'-adenylylsulfate reductase-like 4 [Senna tora]
MGSLRMMRLWASQITVAMLLWGTLTCAAEPEPTRVPLWIRACPPHSITDSILGFRDYSYSPGDTVKSFEYIGFTEGDEISLQKALNMVHRNNNDYVAVLFYAYWCPFSQIFRPTLSILSSLYPSIPHFAIKESAVRPSILSKYGVHGFPTFFILNSTMRVRYHGSRTLGSLIDFYREVTGKPILALFNWDSGVRTVALDQPSLEKIGRLSFHEKNGNIEPESCPFSWARSPENLLRQETYLALATTFVILRLLYFFPTLLICVQCAWKRVVRNVRLGSLLEHPLLYAGILLERIMQAFSCPKESCKRSNLQEGAMNAKAWASKSLATVSIGEGSTSHGMLQ